MLRSRGNQRFDGFTLIELLAVIVILAILATIAISMFANKSDEAKATAHKANMQILSKQAQAYMMGQTTLPVGDITQQLVNSGYIKEIPVNPTTEAADYAAIARADGTVVIVCGGFNGICNSPALVEGMTPIYWDGDSWEATTADNPSSQWYLYNGDINTNSGDLTDGIGTFTADKWANVRLAEGSMFVWIPRYSYKIEDVGNDGSKTNDAIRIKYSSGTIDDTNDGYIPHPAFNLGNQKLTGIWVAKFEASAREGSDNTTNINTNGDAFNGDNITTKHVQIKGDDPTKQANERVQSWRYITISNSFLVCKDMIKDGTYGWTANSSKIDTHMIKNSEWGAVTYLTEAIRDGEEIWNNNYYEYSDGTTSLPAGWTQDIGIKARPGYAGNNKNAAANNMVGVGTYNYNTNIGIKASSTGNIYGIYDLSGGSWERVASYINNGIGSGSGLSLINASDKYKDVLIQGSENFDFDEAPEADNDKKQNNYIITVGQTIGMALHEVMTSGYGSSNYKNYMDKQDFPFNTNPFFCRGGCFSNSSSAGIFACGFTAGTDSGHSFRPIIVAIN